MLTRALVLSLIALGATAIGCRSTSSTITTRSGDDTLVGNSNGTPGIHQQTTPYKGIPVTMKVPSHVDISIRETVYFCKTETETSPGKKTTQITEIALPQRHLTVTHDIRYSDKIITVDPKRPAAGTLDYAMTFRDAANGAPRDNQFFSKIDYNATDETITTINSLIPALFPSAGPPNTKQVHAASANGGTSTVHPKERTVAWKRFDLNDPDFEFNLSNFVSQHLNCETGCGTISDSTCSTCTAGG